MQAGQISGESRVERNSLSAYAKLCEEVRKAGEHRDWHARVYGAIADSLSVYPGTVHLPFETMFSTVLVISGRALATSSSCGVVKRSSAENTECAETGD